MLSAIYVHRKKILNILRTLLRILNDAAKEKDLLKTPGDSQGRKPLSNASDQSMKRGNATEVDATASPMARVPDSPWQTMLPEGHPECLIRTRGRAVPGRDAGRVHRR